MADSLFVTTVPRSLETKNKILGLELVDVLILLVNLSAQNLIFGNTALRYPMVFGTSAVLALLFIVIKRGRPDGFIGHYLEHLFTPGVFEANRPDHAFEPLCGKDQPR